MEQAIRFCTTADGARIAYATVGQGPPVVWPPWLSATSKLDWEDPDRRPFLEELIRHYTLVRYDRCGCGAGPHGLLSGRRGPLLGGRGRPLEPAPAINAVDKLALYYVSGAIQA